MPASTDPESTFVARACECGAAVRDDGLVLGMTDAGLHAALRLGSGTGWWWDCVFFVLDGESCRLRRGRHWRGPRQRVAPAMEPGGGTPQAPHTGHEMFFYGTFVLPRKCRKKRKKKKTWIYFRDFTLSPSMNWKGTNLWEGFRPCSMEFRRDERPSFARLVQSWRMVVILGHE